MVDDFIERRHGRQPIVYLFPELAPILQETYGVIVYQEQVMKIASAIGGYSLGEADILRRAMGKMKVEEMAKQEAIFVSRAKERGFDEKKAKELFDLMAYFAGYGFNKSHSAAYALIAYQTAYLKAHYPAEFFACLISLEATNPEQMVFYIDDAKEMGVTLFPPDINRSQVNFTVSEGKILFGLRGIKNVGTAALESIIKERSTHGVFKDLLDFCTRVDLRTVNTRVIEHLIFSSACRGLPGNRAQQHGELATILELAAAEKKRLLTGQLTLFHTEANASVSEKELYTYKPIQEWPTAELLAREYEVLGFYMSAHPLSSYQDTIALLGVKSICDVPAVAAAQNVNGTVPHRVTVCGILKDKKEVITKKGDRMAFVTLEDLSGQLSVILFPKLFATVEQYLSSHTVFAARGVPDAQVGDCKLKADSFLPLDLVFTQENQIKEVQFKFSQEISESDLHTIKSKTKSGSTPLSILFQEGDRFLCLTQSEKIAPNKEILAAIAKEHSITIRCIL
jgi:DNA polymerase-3 subunit alpha